MPLAGIGVALLCSVALLTGCGADDARLAEFRQQCIDHGGSWTENHSTQEYKCELPEKVER
jgi:hypothetical protein